ncbi:competence type IV pilus ATPase ComGA [Anaerobacillus sp. MEB173]|uniref:competence type IV pilus ATPase ComGA n=1 Tax=Anaerobacillus sp. MEB173 TaxID=3383345 RepID=UPI003F923B0C
MNGVEKKSEQILQQAVLLRASDIHLFPKKDTTLIQFRVDHQLIPVETISKTISDKLISHFKFRAGMDIGERRRPQNGSIQFSFAKQIVNLRLSTIPTANDESLVLRLLPQDETLSLSQLPLFKQSAKQLYSFIKRSNGLILVTGPTGSGKTTTLYAMLYAAQQFFQRNIITLEDPIEKKTDQFLQMEINEKAGLTYSEGIKSILRHDPDIIMIGEIRDEQTAKMAVRASLTGHLVLSTVHSKDTVACLYRLIELGIPIHDLKETLIGIITQRLVEILCPYCGEKCKKWCQKQRRQRRKAIFEILSDQNLNVVIDNLNENLQQFPYIRLEAMLRKAIALGYVSEKAYEQMGR